MTSFLSRVKTLFKQFLYQDGTAPMTGICTDTRSLKSKDLFVALRGEHFDAHTFLPDILDRTAGIVCSSLPNVSLPPHLTVFLVPDTLLFYQDLAKYYLQTKSNLIRIAVTGSAGKTSTKEWLAQLLRKKYLTYNSSGNFNNLVGVPKSALEVREEQVAIFEIGTGKPGDIAQLRDIIDPTWTIVTSVGEAHLEFFSSLERIAQEKASLCVEGKNCYAPFDIPFGEEVFHPFKKISSQELFSSIIPKNMEGFLLTLDSQTFLFPFFGKYNLSNFSLAVTVTMALGVSPSQIAEVSFSPLPSYRAQSFSKGAAQLILDCYNANPLSMAASLESVAQFYPQPILVLGDMLELGPGAPLFHKRLGQILNNYNFPLIFFVGPLMEEAAKVYEKLHYWGETLQDLSIYLNPLFEQKNIFFVKGSRGMHLENIIQL